MYIDFVISEDSRYYSLPDDEVQTLAICYRDERPLGGFRSVYSEGSEMFSYLDKMLSPSDVIQVKMVMYENGYHARLVFDAESIPGDDLAVYLSFYDDLPF